MVKSENRMKIESRYTLTRSMKNAQLWLIAVEYLIVAEANQVMKLRDAVLDPLQCHFLSIARPCVFVQYQKTFFIQC